MSSERDAEHALRVDRRQLLDQAHAGGADNGAERSADRTEGRGRAPCDFVIFDLEDRGACVVRDEADFVRRHAGDDEILDRSPRVIQIMIQCGYLPAHPALLDILVND